jgi:hypothetical protein
MNKFFAVLAFAALSCLGADTPAPQSTAGMEVRVIQLKHLKGDAARSLANSVYNALNPGGIATYDANLNVIILRGYAPQLEPVASLISQSDIPQPAHRTEVQAQLRVHLVAATPSDGGDVAIPPEIAPAIAQMKKTFAFKGYRELDTLMVQTRTEQSFYVEGALPSDPSKPERYRLRGRIASISEDEVTIRDFELQLQGVVPATLQTSITVRKGQKVVVGKLSGENGKDAIFLVVTADIL